MRSTKIFGLLCLAITLSASAVIADECGDVYAACQAQLNQHARCAADYPGDLVADAAAIFELQHSVATSASVGAFGPDAAATSRLERVLAGLKSQADGSLSQPGGVELVLIGDLHRRHAERLSARLGEPRSCEAADLGRLERSCKAGVGEVKALTQGGWPKHVATCVASR